MIRVEGDNQVQSAHAILIALPILGLVMIPNHPANLAEPSQVLRLTKEQASALAKLALKGARKEYPNKPGDVLSGSADVKSPKATHPAFYGCFDWHSSVHGHWMLARVLRQFPDLPDAKEIRGVLAENLTAENLKIEAAHFTHPEAKSYERPYGWSWLLKLAHCHHIISFDRFALADLVDGTHAEAIRFACEIATS